MDAKLSTPRLGAGRVLGLARWSHSTKFWNCAQAPITTTHNGNIWGLYEASDELTPQPIAGGPSKRRCRCSLRAYRTSKCARVLALWCCSSKSLLLVVVAIRSHTGWGHSGMPGDSGVAVDSVKDKAGLVRGKGGPSPDSICRNARTRPSCFHARTATLLQLFWCHFHICSQI